MLFAYSILLVVAILVIVAIGRMHVTGNVNVFDDHGDEGDLWASFILIVAVVGAFLSLVLFIFEAAHLYANVN